jgi:DNA processing protein
MTIEASSNGRWPTIETMDDHLLQRAATVALLRLPGSSWPELAATIIERGDAIDLLTERTRDEGALFSVGPSAESFLESAIRDIESWHEQGVGVHGVLDESYPEQLHDIHQVPPVIFTRGELADDYRAVAVVGTRNASPMGLSIARTISQSLVEAGVTVVSGLALGIDAAAHTAALDAGGRTVAVIGTGINRSYPQANTDLQRRIAKDGLVLSQFWPDSPPTKATFPMRNAVMSGYAAATIVVEAAYRSGARMQARLALEHGRPVVLLHDLLEHDWAKAYSLRPGVYVVGGVADLLATVDKLTSELFAEPEALSELASRPAG